jgi:hypothetical protein
MIIIRNSKKLTFFVIICGSEYFHFLRNSKTREEITSLLREGSGSASASFNASQNPSWVQEALALVQDSLGEEAGATTTTQEKKLETENKPEDKEIDPEKNIPTANSADEVEDQQNGLLPETPVKKSDNQSPISPRGSATAANVLFADLTKLFEDIFHSRISFELIDPAIAASMATTTIAPEEGDSPVIHNHHELSTALRFTEDEETVIDQEKWHDMLATKEYRDRFLKELDIRRCHNSTVTEKGYQSLCNAMKVSVFLLSSCSVSQNVMYDMEKQVFLDYCEDLNDVRSAMRIKNMANTFHHCLAKVTNS